MSAIVQAVKYRTSRLGERKRIWIENARLDETDFKAGKPIDVQIEKHKVVIRITEFGKRKVAKRLSGSVIDIDNRAVASAFSDIDEVTIRIARDKIVVTPLKEKLEQKRAKAKFDAEPTVIDIFCGGGSLSQQLREHGAKIVAAVDIEDAYLNSYEQNFPNATTYATPLQKLDVSLLPDASIVIAGVPCTNFSVAGISSNNHLGRPSREAGETGWLAFAVLQVIAAVRPAVCILEEVPTFSKTGIADVVRGALASMGYHLQETILDGAKLGSMTKRKRWCLVGSMKKGFRFDFKPKARTRTFADILETPVERRQWLTKENSPSIANFFRKQERSIAEGKGFVMGNIVETNDTITGTFPRGYAKRQVTNPLLRHPHNRDSFSFFTAREIATIHNLPKTFKLPASNTTACQIVGQGVDGTMFGQVSELVLNHYRSKENTMPAGGEQLTFFDFVICA